MNHEHYYDPTADIAIGRVSKQERLEKRRRSESKKQGGGKMEKTPKLKTVKRLDSIRLDKNDSTYFTKEGYLVDHPILTSCGIFEYANPDGSIRRELRLPEHVFAEESLKTYKGKPIIITHDAGVVDKNNVQDEQIGTILSEAYQDGNDVRAEIIIHNTDAMKDCGLKELSLGYKLDLVEEPGEWNGEPYDAIQTNIVINHLALVSSARAGEQARLNIDGKDTLKGGKAMGRAIHYDGDLSPEELEEALADYKAKKEAAASNEDAEDKVEEEAIEEVATDSDETPEEVTDECKKDGVTPEEMLNGVKERKDRRDSEDAPEDMDKAKEVIAQQDADLDMLIATLEKVLAELKGNTDGCDEEVNEDEAEEVVEEEVKEDSSEDMSESMNADSIDEIIRQRLAICRVGDKLHLDGLESKSMKDAKKAIVAKVLPTMNLDGKSDVYVDAAYDLAVGEMNKRKDANYQKEQMAKKPEKRMDGKETTFSAAEARQRMIDREGGR